VKLLKTPQVPEDVWTSVMAVRDEIVNGTVKVEPVFEATAVRALMSDVKE
jgi:simple sugar transport system substrate-binding protein